MCAAPAACGQDDSRAPDVALDEESPPGPDAPGPVEDSPAYNAPADTSGGGDEAGADVAALPCPPAHPAYGSPCADDGAVCQYGDLICPAARDPDVCQCAFGWWDCSHADCPERRALCPATEPSSGESCASKPQGLACDWDYPCARPGFLRGHTECACAGVAWTCKYADGPCE